MSAEYCECCGAKIVEYKHRLNRVLCRALEKLYAKGPGDWHLEQDLDLTHSEQDNFQKLRYFGLVEKSFDSDGLRIKGCWRITTKGRLFVEGSVWCYPAVWTWRGDPIRFEEEPVEITDILPPIQEAADYAAEAQPHDPIPEEKEDDESDQ